MKENEKAINAVVSRRFFLTAAAVSSATLVLDQTTGIFTGETVTGKILQKTSDAMYESCVEQETCSPDIINYIEEKRPIQLPGESRYDFIGRVMYADRARQRLETIAALFALGSFVLANKGLNKLDIQD